MRAGANGHRERFNKCGEQKKAPAFQPRGQRPERLLCHVFESNSTDKQAIVSPVGPTTTTNSLHIAMNSIISRNQSTE